MSAAGATEDFAGLAALSQEFVLACDASGRVTACDGRATRRLGLRPGASLFDVVRRGTEPKLASLLSAGLRRDVPDWEVLLAVDGRALTVSFCARPIDGGVTLVGCIVPEGYARALEQVSGALSEIASLHRETERHQRDLMRVHEALEEAARRDAFLAAASGELSEGDNLRAALRAVLSLAVPQFAEWAVIDVREGAEVDRLASTHADPAREPAAATVAWPGAFTRDDGLGRTLRRGTSELLEGAALASFTVDAAGQAWLDLLGTAALLIAPLVVRGRAFGALLLGAGQRERLDTRMIPLAEDLARRIALAADNARMSAAAQAAEIEREAALLEAARALVGPAASLLASAARVRSAARDDRQLEIAADIERVAREQSRSVERVLDVIDSLRRSRLSGSAPTSSVDPGTLLGAVARAPR